MTLVILYSISPQDLNSWLWMASRGFGRTEFSYFRLVWDIYEGFRQTTGSFSTMLLMRAKHQNKSKHFLILREISNTLCLCKPHIHVWCASLQEYLIEEKVDFTLVWEDKEVNFIGLYWKNTEFLLATEFTAFEFSFLFSHSAYSLRPIRIHRTPAASVWPLLCPALTSLGEDRHTFYFLPSMSLILFFQL